jgi:hypothetical protein
VSPVNRDREKPKNVAFGVDFNRVEVEGHPPDIVETGLDQLGCHVAAVIRRIIKEMVIPEHEEFSYVLNVIALLAIRNPAMRRSMTVSERHMYRVIGDLFVSNRKLYERQFRRAREASFVAADKDVRFEVMRDFTSKGRLHARDSSASAPSNGALDIPKHSSAGQRSQPTWPTTADSVR